MLDGLEIREEAWRKTAQFLESGTVDDELFIAEECNGPEEASNIADDYRAIIDKIRKQLAAQLAQSGTVSEREAYFSLSIWHYLSDSLSELATNWWTELKKIGHDLI